MPSHRFFFALHAAQLVAGRVRFLLTAAGLAATAAVAAAAVAAAAVADVSAVAAVAVASCIIASAARVASASASSGRSSQSDAICTEPPQELRKRAGSIARTPSTAGTISSSRKPRFSISRRKRGPGGEHLNVAGREWEYDVGGNVLGWLFLHDSPNEQAREYILHPENSISIRQKLVRARKISFGRRRTTENFP